MNVCHRIEHEHVYGGGSICNDLLTNFASWFANQDAGKTVPAASGWSSACSVETVLLQMQIFFSEPRKDHGGRPVSSGQKLAVARDAEGFVCSRCGHSHAAPMPPVPTQAGGSALEPQSAGSADEIACSVTRLGPTEAILGFGLSVTWRRDGAKIDRLGCTFEFLSQDAFNGGSRASSYGDKFEWLLPMYISAEHWQRSPPAAAGRSHK